MTILGNATSRTGCFRNAFVSLLTASIGICGVASRVQAQTISLPGQFEAENFDNGGEGVAYHDVEAANLGGQYRPTEGVDIQATSDTGGGFNVGWTKAGEWLRYAVN